MPEVRIQPPTRRIGEVSLAARDRPGSSTLGWARAGNEWWDDKENIPPGQRRGQRDLPKRSPLPLWYPRTPLRDITAVVNTMNWRSRRQQEAGNQIDASAVGAVPLASPMTEASTDSEETLSFNEADFSPALEVSLVPSPSPSCGSGADTHFVDIPHLQESTTSNIDGRAEDSSIIWEELELIFKEKMKVASEIQQTKKKQERSHLMRMR